MMTFTIKDLLSIGPCLSRIPAECTSHGFLYHSPPSVTSVRVVLCPPLPSVPSVGSEWRSETEWNPWNDDRNEPTKEEA